jgi:hypothetical protein
MPFQIVCPENEPIFKKSKSEARDFFTPACKDICYLHYNYADKDYGNRLKVKWVYKRCFTGFELYPEFPTTLEKHQKIANKTNTVFKSPRKTYPRNNTVLSIILLL